MSDLESNRYYDDILELAGWLRHLARDNRKFANREYNGGVLSEVMHTGRMKEVEKYERWATACEKIAL